MGVRSKGHCRTSFDRAGWLLLAYVGLLAVYTWSAPGGADRRTVVDIGQTVTPLVTAVLGLRAFRRETVGMDRWAWLALGLFGVASFLGEALWGYYEIVLGQDVPTPSIADVAWGFSYLFGFLGVMLQIPRGQEMAARATPLLDSLMFTLGAVALSWQFILRPSLLRQPDPLLAIVNISWLVGDLLLIFALVSMLLRLPPGRMPAHSLFLLAGYTVQVVADSIFYILLLDGSYQTGNPIDPLWALAYALVGIAALNYAGRTPAERMASLTATFNFSWTRKARVALPYLVFPVLGVTLYSQHSDLLAGQTGAGVTAVLAVAVALLVFLRQILTVVENNRLNYYLAALNHMATELSHCVNSQDVLSAGLKLAGDAVRPEVAAIWTCGPNGSLAMAACSCGSEDAGQLLADLPQRAPAVARSIVEGLTSSLREDDLSQQLAESHRGLPALSTLLIVPLLSRRSVMGALGLGFGSNHRCTDSDVQLAQAIGAQMGVALENAKRYEDAVYLADRDPVTELLNHRAIYQRLEQEMNRSQQAATEFSLVMMDLDNFKLFNDSYGHQVGDRVLADMAALLSKIARESDGLGRYGGDEFVAILPDTDSGGAAAFAERVRSSLARHPFHAPDGAEVPICMSFGLASYPRDGRQATELVAFADANLYESKRQGGDTITVARDRALASSTTAFHAVE